MKQSLTKRIFAVLCVITLILPCVVSMASDEKPVTVFVDGQQIMFDVQPIIENGRTLVPMRFIFEALGATVKWDDVTFTATAVRDDVTINIQIGNNVMYKNDNPVELDVPAKLENSRTLVPVRAISESFGLKVDWIQEENKVVITSVTDYTIVDEQDNIKPVYDYSELSPADKIEFMKYAEYVRYYFEQYILYNEILSVAPEFSQYITLQSEALPGVVNEVWDAVFIEEIIALQIESNDSYANITTNINDTNALENAYKSLLKSLSLDSQSVMNVNYAITPKGTSVLLLEFKNHYANDPTVVFSKYIGIVPAGNGIRYFTLENSGLGSEMLGREVNFFCELTGESRSNYAEVSADKQSFLKAIDSYCN